MRFGRRQNPKDHTGEIMKCSVCISMEHLRAFCPQNKGKGKGGGAPSGPPEFGYLEVGGADVGVKAFWQALK